MASTSRDELLLRVEIRKSAPLPSGCVVLLNMGSTAIGVWRTSNQWGDSALSFEILQGDLTWRVVRKIENYTVNIPSSVEVLAGEGHEWPFDLGDGQWETDARIDRLTVPGTQLVAVYEVPLSPEAAIHGVWTGRLRSKPVPCD